MNLDTASLADAIGARGPLRIDTLPSGALRAADGTQTWLIEPTRNARRAQEVATLLRALREAGAAVPEVIEIHDAFVICANVEGRPGDASLEAIVDALAHVHTVTADVAPARATIERVLAQITERYEAARKRMRPAYPVEELGSWLRARLPAEYPARVVHCAFSPDAAVSASGAVDAITGWRSASMGDPFVDLGDLIATTDVPEQHIVDRYVDAGGRAPDDIGYYAVLGIWRVAVGVYAEASERRRTDQTVPRLCEEANAVAARAQRFTSR